MGCEDGCARFPWSPIAIYMPIGYYMSMKRTALFLKEAQLKKLKALSNRTGAPLAELIRRAIDRYLQERAKESK
jgi:sulfite reductase beta subunit-like hemoprotein